MSVVTAKNIVEFEEMAAMFLNSNAYRIYQRQRAAEAALQGLLASPNTMSAPGREDDFAVLCAGEARRMADALIAELAKPVNP